MTKERPILFSAEMIRAILEGRKTQTRRIVKGVVSFDYEPPSEIQESYDVQMYDLIRNGDMWTYIPPCDYGTPGDQLWVRENIRFGIGYDGVKPSAIPKEPHIKRWYEADTGLGQVPHGFGVLRPNIFMPRYFSRILLDITGIRVERLNDISEEDARAEGVPENMTYVPVQIGQGAMEALKAGGHTQFLDKMVNPPVMQDWRAGFHRLWESINGEDSWDQNPWVWVIEFRRIKP